MEVGWVKLDMMRFLTLPLITIAVVGCSDSRGAYEGDSDDVKVLHVRDFEYHRPVVGPDADKFKDAVLPILQKDKSVHSAYFVFATGRKEDGERATLVVIADGSVNPTRLIDEMLVPTEFAKELGGVDTVFLGGRDEEEIKKVCEPFFDR